MLVAVDGGECAERAFTRALSIAKPEQDSIILAYIIDAVRNIAQNRYDLQCTLFIHEGQICRCSIAKIRLC